MLGTRATATTGPPTLRAHAYHTRALLRSVPRGSRRHGKQPPRGMYWKAGTLLSHTRGTFLQLSAEMSCGIDFHEETVYLLMCSSHPGERHGGEERTATAQKLHFFILQNPLTAPLVPQDHLKASSKSNTKFSYAEKYFSLFVRPYQSDTPRQEGGRTERE